VTVFFGFLGFWVFVLLLLLVGRKDGNKNTETSEAGEGMMNIKGVVMML